MELKTKLSHRRVLLMMSDQLRGMVSLYHMSRTEITGTPDFDAVLSQISSEQITPLTEALESVASVFDLLANDKRLWHRACISPELQQEVAAMFKRAAGLVQGEEDSVERADSDRHQDEREER